VLRYPPSFIVIYRYNIIIYLAFLHLLPIVTINSLVEIQDNKNDDIAKQKHQI